MSLFGSGLGPLSPAPATGGMHPIPPGGPLSESRLVRGCIGCEILYMGSVPGLSTAVVQINVRIPRETGPVRPHPIGIGVAESQRQLFVGASSSVVFVK